MYEEFWSGLSHEDAQGIDDWTLRIKGQLANPGLLENNR